MSDHFSNGLKLIAPAASQCGRTFSRWLVEYLTVICGWTVHDLISGNWTNYEHQDTLGSVDATDPAVFSIGAFAHTFTSSDIGSYLTITGFPTNFASRNGIYYIEKIISANSVRLGIERCMHEDGMPTGTTGLTWRLWRPTATYVPTSGNVIVLKGTGVAGGGYDFHLHINVRSSNSYFPEFRISPFASWNNVSHAWNDSRYTAAKGIDSWNSSLSNVDNVRIWSAADSDRAVIMMRVEDDQYAWHFIYLGEIEVQDEVLDPKPCILWTGSNGGNGTVGDDANTLLGTGYSGTVASGGLWLAYDELTSVTGYATFAHCATSQDYHWLSDSQRIWQEVTRRRIRQWIVCESRTAGFMELRGQLKRVWVASRDTPRLIVYGTNGEFLHVIGGLTLPWFNSKVWYQR